MPRVGFNLTVLLVLLNTSLQSVDIMKETLVLSYLFPLLLSKLVPALRVIELTLVFM